MANVQKHLEGLEKKWEICKAQDDEKHSLITVRSPPRVHPCPPAHLSFRDLFKYIEDLRDQLAETESELRDKKVVVKDIRGRLESANKLVKDLQHERVKQDCCLSPGHLKINNCQARHVSLRFSLTETLCR